MPQTKKVKDDEGNEYEIELDDEGDSDELELTEEEEKEAYEWLKQKREAAKKQQATSSPTKPQGSAGDRVRLKPRQKAPDPPKRGRLKMRGT